MSCWTRYGEKWRKQTFFIECFAFGFALSKPTNVQTSSSTMSLNWMTASNCLAMLWKNIRNCKFLKAPNRSSIPQGPRKKSKIVIPASPRPNDLSGFLSSTLMPTWYQAWWHGIWLRFRGFGFAALLSSSLTQQKAHYSTEKYMSNSWTLLH